jgi:hypothetical protein
MFKVPLKKGRLTILQELNTLLAEVVQKGKEKIAKTGPLKRELHQPVEVN